MKRHSFVGVMLAVLLLVGCSGGKYYQSWPMESKINGTEYHYHNAVQLNLPATMFHATNSENWVEYCRTKLANPVTEEEFLYPFQDCVREDQYHLSTMGSVASQFVTPVLTTSMYAGSIAFAGHQIGRGLAKSGTTVNQQGGGASSDASADADAAAGAKAGASNMTNSGNKTTNIKPQTNINSGNKIFVK